MCNPAGGLHGGMMMTVADLVGTMGGGTLVGLRKFLPTVSMTFDFVAPAKVGDWVEGRAEVVRQTRSLLFTNIYLTVGEEKFLRASQIGKIPSGEGWPSARRSWCVRMPSPNPPALPKAVLFDLLTALLDSWTLWNRVAGSEAAGAPGAPNICGSLTVAAVTCLMRSSCARRRARRVCRRRWPTRWKTRWYELPVWSGAQAALDALKGRTKLAVVTNCSVRLGAPAAARLNTRWDCLVTAEEAGFY